MKYDIEKYLFACLLLAISNVLWAFHDFYFWDTVTHAWVKRIFGDWHLLKTLMIGFFSISLLVVPRKPLYLVSMLFIRWASFELGCNFASMSKPYVPCPGFWGIFGLETFQAIAVLFLIVLLVSIIELAGKNGNRQIRQNEQGRVDH